jgi:hypothetical protein
VSTFMGAGATVAAPVTMLNRDFADVDRPSPGRNDSATEVPVPEVSGIRAEQGRQARGAGLSLPSATRDPEGKLAACELRD